MLIDYHCHVLPGIDDGAKDAEMSLAMLAMLRKQGVEQVIATPHFYAHREKSVDSFLEKRQQAFEKIGNTSPLPILLGAEIAIEHNICELQGIEQLAIQGTNLILLELPYREYEEWMLEEIYNISAEYGLKVILAHIHRYLGYYTKEQMCRILDSNAVFQINTEAYNGFSQRGFVKSILKQERPFVFGSDTHNITDRKPNWEALKKKCKPESIARSNEILMRYARKQENMVSENV